MTTVVLGDKGGDMLKSHIAVARMHKLTHHTSPIPPSPFDSPHLAPYVFQCSPAAHLISPVMFVPSLPTLGVVISKISACQMTNI